MAADSDGPTKEAGAPDFLRLAAEARAAADRVWTATAQRTLIGIATRFAALAQEAEWRKAAQTDNAGTSS